MTAQAEEIPVHNPASIEQHIEQTVNRIAKGVKVVTDAERNARERRRAFDHAYATAYAQSESAAHVRKYEADIATMAQRKDAEDAEIAFRHAERQAKALEKELIAWQSINSNIRAMYGAAGVR